MKPITIDNEDYLYKTASVYSFGDTYPTTYFYKGEELAPAWRFWWFKSRKMVKIPKLMFSINMNIEAPYHSKQSIREKIDSEMRLIRRKLEIERGEII